MDKVWKKINGFDTYSVSNKGEVRNDKTLRILKPWVNTHGYYQVALYKNYKRIAKQVHRLVAEAFIPNPEGKPTVNHKDEKGTKEDNRVENLEWATMSEQMKHVFDNNLTSNIGDTHHNSKIKKSDIPYIFSKRKKGYTHKQIAVEHNVTRQAIGLILNNKSYIDKYA